MIKPSKLITLLQLAKREMERNSLTNSSFYDQISKIIYAREINEELPENWRNEIDYIESPNHCKYCGSSHLDADTPQLEEHTDNFYEKVTCLDCKETWIDIYGIIGTRDYTNTEETCL